jgi:hypothetical protein
MSISRTRPTPVHEELARVIQEMVRTELEAMASTMGTVVGTDGGMIRVQVDEEGDPRQVGIPAIKGQRHSVGNRVLLHRLRGKDWVLGGSITNNSAGFDPAVGNQDLHNDVVDYRALDGIIANDISTARTRADDGISRANTAQGTANNAVSAAGNAQNTANDARNRANTAQGTANTAQDRANSAQSTADNAKNTADAARKKLSGQVLKVKSDNTITLPTF